MLIRCQINHDYNKINRVLTQLKKLEAVSVGSKPGTTFCFFVHVFDLSQIY